MQKPLITLVIPTYNEEEFIEKCLKSIEKQTIKNKIEVLIIDDDSTDNTIKIAKSFSRKINIKIIRNGTRDAEKGKKIGLMQAEGEFFMYLDADMELADDAWAEVISKPLIENKKIIGSLARFKPNSNQNSLTRCISYDIFQRDPLFIFMTPVIKETIIEKKEDYSVCKFEIDKIPCQSLCLYRTDILKKLFKNYSFLMDNDVPVVLVKNKYNLFAFAPQVGVYHNLLNSLYELYNKRMRGVLKTYMAHLPKREYKWLNLEKKRNFFLLAIYIIYSNLIFPATLYGIYKAFKYRDIACLNEPLITLVSTDSLIIGFIKSKKGASSLFKV
jgi:glycosyltransferase involved in cell wall biosynthesis